MTRSHCGFRNPDRLNRRNIYACRTVIFVTLIFSVLLFSKNGIPFTENPHLTNGLSKVSHFNSAQQDSIDGQLADGFYLINPNVIQTVYGFPLNLFYTNSPISYPNGDRVIWVSNGTRVAKILISNGKFNEAATIPLFGLPEVSKISIQEFIDTVDKVKTLQELKDILQRHPTFSYTNIMRMASNGGHYCLMSDEGVFYTCGVRSLAGFVESDKSDARSSIMLKYQIDLSKYGIFNKTSKWPDSLLGINMTYEGYIVAPVRSGKVVFVDKHFKQEPIVVRFEEDEAISNSIAIDETGVYVVTSKYMRKLVLDPKKNKVYTETNGAWKCEYDITKGGPAVVDSVGSGSTPSLMQAGEDRLVVITDGAKRMKLVAIWADDIPPDFKSFEGRPQRYAGHIQPTFGFSKDANVQSEQSVVVKDNYALVVNNVIQNLDEKPSFIEHAIACGPILPPAYGMELVKWNKKENKWAECWSRSDVSSPSAIPLIAGDKAFTQSYTAGTWEFTGVNLNSGEITARYRMPNSQLFNGGFGQTNVIEKGGNIQPLISGFFGVTTFDVSDPRNQRFNPKDYPLKK